MSQSQSNIINNKKALLCSRTVLQKQGRAGLKGPIFTEDNLLKYFPKYIHKLQTETFTARTISRVKRVKILHVFEGYQRQTQSKNLKRTLLYNKEKHIQVFYNEYYGARLFAENPRHLIQGIRAFTGLQSLILSPSLYESQRMPCFKIISKYIKSLTKLKYLKLGISQSGTERDLKAISRINSHHERVLESLETLKIDCRWGDDPDPEETITLLRGLLKNKNVLKSTTNLYLGSLNHQTVFDLFEDLLACCPKIVSLLFGTEKPKPEENSWDDESPFEEYAPQYLKALGKLNNLQVVTIIAQDVPTFLSDFTLPPSIQHVSLSLIPFESSRFRDPQVLSTFYDRWSHLINLKTLKIRLGQYFDSKGLTLKILHSWLKKVPTLRGLFLELSSDVPSKSPWGLSSMQGDFDFSAFFESIQHLKEALESLSIIDERKIYCLKNLPEWPFEFPRLRQLAFNGSMLNEKFEVQRLFQMNLKDLLMAGKNEKTLELFLHRLDFDSLKPIMSFIKSFDQERNEQQSLSHKRDCFLEERYLECL